jgi:hypothetical protein
MIIAAALALAGCGTTGNSTIISSIQAFEQAVQQDAAAACAFLPTTATVAGIVASLFPGVSVTEQIAAQVAAQICSAVTAASPAATGGRFGDTPVYFPGTNVVIHGTFVSARGRRH